MKVETVEAKFEQGVFRPLEEMRLDEGESVRLTVIRSKQWDPERARQAVERIASLPIEATDERNDVSVRHDEILYGENPA